ncbi:hypothetical protein [Vibrio comitans]|uniref:hypothetical protein n=1 Tax=Vibrio comitans TaxID=413401 RepID=UPI003B987C3C
MESVSALFFVQYRKSNDSMRAFYQKIQKERLIETINDQDRRADLILKLIK